MSKIITMCIWGQHDFEKQFRDGYMALVAVNMIDENDQFFTVYIKSDDAKTRSLSQIADIIGMTITKEFNLVLKNAGVKIN